VYQIPDFTQEGLGYIRNFVQNTRQLEGQQCSVFAKSVIVKRRTCASFSVPMKKMTKNDSSGWQTSETVRWLNVPLDPLNLQLSLAGGYVWEAAVSASYWSQLFAESGLAMCSPFLDSRMIRAALNIDLEAHFVPGNPKQVIKNALLRHVPPEVVTAQNWDSASRFSSGFRPAEHSANGWKRFAPSIGSANQRNGYCSPNRTGASGRCSVSTSGMMLFFNEDFVFRFGTKNGKKVFGESLTLHGPSWSSKEPCASCP